MVHTKEISLIKSKSEAKSLITGNEGLEFMRVKIGLALDLDETNGEING